MRFCIRESLSKTATHLKLGFLSRDVVVCTDLTEDVLQLLIYSWFVHGLVNPLLRGDKKKKHKIRIELLLVFLHMVIRHNESCLVVLFNIQRETCLLVVWVEDLHLNAVYLDPLLLFHVPFVGLGLEAFPSILLVFTDALDVVPVVVSPEHKGSTQRMYTEDLHRRSTQRINTPSQHTTLTSAQ